VERLRDEVKELMWKETERLRDEVKEVERLRDEVKETERLRDEVKEANEAAGAAQNEMHLWREKYKGEMDLASRWSQQCAVAKRERDALLAALNDDHHEYSPPYDLLKRAGLGNNGSGATLPR
jgi:hypothetical protein